MHNIIVALIKKFINCNIWYAFIHTYMYVCVYIHIYTSGVTWLNYILFRRVMLHTKKKKKITIFFIIVKLASFYLFLWEFTSCDIVHLNFAPSWVSRVTKFIVFLSGFLHPLPSTIKEWLCEISHRLSICASKIFPWKSNLIGLDLHSDNFNKFYILL